MILIRFRKRLVLFVAAVFLAGVFLSGCEAKNSCRSSDIEVLNTVSRSKADMKDSNTIVNLRINELIEGSGFSSGSETQRYDLAKKLLDELLAEGYITNCDYDDREKMFTFNYENGLQGGVDLKDYTKSPGGLYMN